MKKLFSLAVLGAFALAGAAQNSVVYKADALLEQNKAADALELLKTSFDNPKTTKFGEIYNKAGKCARILFQPLLVNAANSQPLDTAQFISRLDDMVDYYTKSYVFEHTPDAKGKMPKPEYSNEATQVLYNARDYYFYAGIFLNSNGNKPGAYKYLGKFVDYPDNPALATKRDSMRITMAKEYAQALYYRAMLANDMKDYDGVLSNVDGAFKYDKKVLEEAKVSVRDLYLLRMQTYLDGKKDTTAYVNALKDAIEHLDDNANLLENLISVYYQNNDIKSAEATANDLLKNAPEKASSWYIRGCVDLNLKKDYAAAREAFAKALAIDPNHVEANANMAYAYINDVITKKMNGKYKYAGSNLSKVKGNAAIALYNKELKDIQSYYSKALPYMEKVRQLAPDRVKLWAPTLQQIYQNLLRKAEAKQMDDLLDAANHR